MLRSLIASCRRAAQNLQSMEPAPVALFSFDSPAVVEQWHVFTDAFFGGKSTAALTFNAAEQAAEFAGRVSLEQEEDADIRRAGYCVASSKVTRIGDYFDLSGCTSLAYEVCGDGRTYIANVRTDSIAGTGGDVWQAPFRTLPGQWSRVTIPISSLALTYQGQLVEQRLEFQADKVIGVGVAASALPDTEAADAVDVSSSSSSLGGASSSSSGAGSNEALSEGSETDGGGTNAPGTDGSCPVNVPEHERFRLLIRSIRAEV